MQILQNVNNIIKLKEKISEIFNDCPLDFCIIGCQKSGTTALMRNLMKILLLHIPKAELNFFNNKINCDHNDDMIEWYKKQILGCEGITEIRGEKSPNYIVNFTSLQKLKFFFPNVKIIIMFRNPITRIFSNYNHAEQVANERVAQGIPQENWKTWIGYKPNILFEEKFDMKKKLIENKKAAGNYDYDDFIGRGLYYEQLKNVYKVFDKKNVHIIINENFRKNTNSQFDDVCRFIGVDECFIQEWHENQEFKNVHTRKYTNEFSIKQVKMLIDFYKMDIEKFYKLIGHRIEEWDQFIDIYSKNHFKDRSPDLSYNLSISDNIIYNSSHSNLLCIIICVDYSDFLTKTLPLNKKLIPNILIVTSTDDTDTHLICEKNNIKYIKYDFLNKSTKKFKKSKAINDTIKNNIKKNYEWILLIDADIILPNSFLDISMNNLDKDILYGCNRIIYKTPDDLKNNNALYDTSPPCIGFFQLFNINSKNFYTDYFGYDERFDFANGGDYYFKKKWKLNKLFNFCVAHLGPIETNWGGRISNIWS